MSRRTAGLTALAATLVVGGFVPALLGGASATGGCPVWTDPAGDAITGQPPQDPTGKLYDANMDITSVSFTPSETKLTAVIKVATLTAAPSDLGDEFDLDFTVAGKHLQIYSVRDSNDLDTGTSIYNFTDKKDFAGKATAAFDVKASTVTLAATMADLTTAAAVPITGKVASALSAGTSDYVAPAGEALAYDDATTTATVELGVDCAGGGGPAPTPTASSSPSPSPSPTATPGGSVIPEATPGCVDVKDGKGDAPMSSAAGGNDPDLDITGAVFRTTADKFIAYLLVDKLATRPAQAPGHTFYADFTVNAKAVSMFAASYDPAAIGTARNAGTATGVLLPTNQLRVGGTYQAGVVVDADFNTTKSLVTISVKRSDLAKAVGSTLDKGTPLTLVKVRSNADFGGVTPAGGDSAGGTATDTLAVDGNACFGPPPAVLANTGAVTSQYGDAANVAAKLTSQAGAALAGKTVTFGLAGKAVIATTNAAGVASAAIPLGVTAGPQTLSIAFAGDATADKVSMTTPFTVVQEKTKLILAITKKGTARTIVATLLDDDNKPVVGQKLVFAVNGKTVATLTTNSSGKATFTKANPSQTVKVTFAAVTGKWLGTTTQVKV